MINIIVLFSNTNDARKIRNALVQSGIEVTAVCTSASQVIQRFGDLEEGLIVCGYRYTDMMIYELREYLPAGFEMLVLVSKAHQQDVEYLEHTTIIQMPVKLFALVSKAQSLLSMMMEKKRKRKRKKILRTPEEEEMIKKAKQLLMENNQISEEQAHSYLQKRSMDSGVTLVETAKNIIESFIC